ncbi:MAG: pilin [Candidatus Paceibacterota bacterium]
MNKLIITFLILFIGFSVFSPITFAETNFGGDGDINSKNPIWGGRNPVTCNVEGACGLCDAFKVGANITDFMINIALLLGVLMTVYGGFLMMTAGSSQEKYSRGKSAITWAIIGMIVVLSSWVIVNTLIHVLAGEGVNVPWATISC